MTLGRRQLLGAMVGSAASLWLPRASTPAKAEPLFWGTVVVPESPVSDPALASPAPAAASGAPALLPLALAALDRHSASVAMRDRIGIVDFSVPSRTPRFYLVDLAGGTTSAPLLVAHGKGSDPANRGMVEHLSNRPGSDASCSGSFMTREIYSGKHGHSRRLIGLDPENSLAEERGIVIHAASYVGRSLAEAQGRIGRSQGCFAVSPGSIADVLERLGPGRLLFAAR
ncbi:MAG: murein L,D-transpeptidase catalytic domain family protein [Novosphingobium sp.]